MIPYCVGKIIIRPQWTGKVSTVSLMVALSWVMLRLDWLPPPVSVIPAKRGICEDAVHGHRATIDSDLSN